MWHSSLVYGFSHEVKKKTDYVYFRGEKSSWAREKLG